jgi:hypothetical protein
VITAMLTMVALLCDSGMVGILMHGVDAYTNGTLLTSFPLIRCVSRSGLDAASA